jgi:hypothetical protein
MLALPKKVSYRLMMRRVTILRKPQMARAQTPLASAQLLP